MKNVLIVFGTRPEAIKMAPLVKELQKHPESFRTLVCVTAQHREMLDQVMALFDIRADFDMNIMSPGQDLTALTAAILVEMKKVLDRAKPDMVLVHGDTTTTLSASLASFYAGIPVGHVEAGLRTGSKRAPFPEEINRKIAGCIADIHFAPTAQARANLLGEGIQGNTIYVTGNTVIDALQMIVKMIDEPQVESAIIGRMAEKCPTLREIFSERSSEPASRILLVTGHRRESFGSGFENICQALKDIALARKDVHILYPVHLNPQVQEPVHRILRNLPNVHLLEPIDYLHFAYLMRRAYFVITDSGGVQEEASALGRPVLVMREATERVEALSGGTAKLVGMRRADIVEASNDLLDNASLYSKMSQPGSPYGDGRAAQRIVDILSA